MLEILVAASVGLLIIAAAMAVFNTLNLQVQDADRKTQAISNIQLGTAVMVRDLENAGWHFPSATRAMTIRNNVALGVLSNGQAGTVAIVARPAVSSTGYPAMSPEGIVEGTDVVEVLKGTAAGHLSQVVTSGTGGVQSLTFNPINDVVTKNAMGNGPALLFRNSTTECLGLMIADAAAPNNIQMLTREFDNDAAGPASCPVVGMEVTRLQDRFRYMVYQFHGELTPTLAVQRSIDNTGTLSATVDPLVEGIEDMQISGSLRNRGVCGAPGDKICSCDDGRDDATGAVGMGTDCVLDQTGVLAKYLRGAHIEFTARAAKYDLGVLPSSYDRPASVVVDNYRRHQLFISVVAPNINPDFVPYTGGSGGGP